MLKNLKKNIRKAGIFSLVLAQVAACGFVAPLSANAFAGSAMTRQMENLDRGVVAVKTDDGVFISWRRLATEPADTKFTLYRNDQVVADDAITNFVDKGAGLTDKYTVVADGKMSDTVSVLEDQYIEIPLGETPEYTGSAVTSRAGVYYPGYTPGDSTYGDLDGDGQYEIIMLWNPDDAKDAASTGQTGKVYMDAYKLDGTQLWRIDMGYNVRAGAHDTQFAVADFDSDGRAEVMVKTADGTVDGQGKVIGDASKGDTYENSWAAKNAGKNLLGPQYITVFDGETGAALDTTDYYPGNDGTDAFFKSFGDDFGNRSERYNATIANIHGTYPSAVFTRGYYFGKNISTPNGRTGAMAVSFRNGKLTTDWTFDTSNSGYEKYIGQGNHQIEAGDVDGDGKDEILYGALTWDDDGSILWCTFQEHGDAMHLGDFDPTKEGLEFVKVYEDYGADSAIFALNGPELSPFITSNTILKNSAAAAKNGAPEDRHQWGISIQNAKTGEFYQIHNGIKDTGRGMVGNIGYKDSFYVMWGAGSSGYWDNNSNEVGDLKASMNGRIYWDGDLQDELQDHKGAGKEIVVSKWNDSTAAFEDLFVPADTHSINSTKGNVNAQGDIIGDWREEFVTYAVIGEESKEEKMTFTGTWDAVKEEYRKVDVVATRTTKKYALRIYTTTIPTEYNFYTLAHDDIYRNSSGVYANCYNQPPHISWYMNDAIEGSQYTTQPDANVTLVANKYKAKAFDAASLPKGGAAVVTPTTNPFGDITGHWAEKYITEMYEAGVINGMTETTFVPENPVTKGQFVKLIVAALGLEVGTDGVDTHWAVPYVTAAKGANLINDAIAVETKADLDKAITREEMASMVASAAKYKKVEIPVKEGTFTDADAISAWAVADVDAAVALGIVTGFENDDKTYSFKPADGATRAQAATMLSRLFAAVK
ncbi:MAG: S-layer homology domain-containing protein [Clostridia bacterium]